MKYLHDRPTLFEDLFQNGMDREVSELCVPPDGHKILNLGAGTSRFGGPLCFAAGGYKTGALVDLDLPGWSAPMLNDFDTETVSAIHAYHFLEHLEVDVLRKMLSECQRVLVPYGVMYIVVPYARADLAFQDIDHKTFFTEESWKTLFNNSYYNTTYGQADLTKLKVTYNMIAGIKGANLAIFTQLVKG